MKQAQVNRNAQKTDQTITCPEVAVEGQASTEIVAKRSNPSNYSLLSNKSVDIVISEKSLEAEAKDTQLVSGSAATNSKTSRNDSSKSSDRCTIEIEKLTELSEVAEFLDSSFDREWQEKILSQSKIFYPWIIDSTESVHEESETKTLDILQNLLASFPFHVTYETVEPPVLLPLLGLSTFFDDFFPNREIIPLELPQNFNLHFEIENPLASELNKYFPKEVIEILPEKQKREIESEVSRRPEEPDDDKKIDSEADLIQDQVILEHDITIQKKTRYKNFPSLVLQKIINLSRTPDIFKWRLINKHWNSICISHLQKTIVPKLNFSSEAHVKTFLRFSKCPKLTVFTSFSLNKLILRPPLTPWEFFTKFGPHCIKILQLRYDALIWVDRFRELLSYLPNLERLSMGITRFRGARLRPLPDSAEILGDIDLPVLKHLRLVNFYGGGGTFSFQDFLHDFFSTFAPYVEVVQAKPEDFPVVSKEFHEKLICGSLSLRKLRKFDFPICAGELTLKKLAGCRLPIQEMVLIIKESQIRSDIVYKLLKSVTQTLKILEIIFDLFKQGRQQTFEIPGLKNLERLTMKNYYGGTDGLAFLEKCSGLKSLDISEVDGYETMLPEKLLRMENVIEAKLSPIAYASTWAFQKILGMFPKIRKLKIINAEDFVLRAIFVEVEALEELSLTGTFTDEGITGIPGKKCKDILKLGIETTEGARSRESVCISNLKNLRHLHLAGSVITDVSVLYGVTGIPNLSSVSLSGKNITNRSLISIINKLQRLQKLRLFKCSSISAELQLLVWEQFHDEISLVFEDIKHLQGAPKKPFRVSKESASSHNCKTKTYSDQIIESAFLEIPKGLRESASTKIRNTCKLTKCCQNPFIQYITNKQ